MKKLYLVRHADKEKTPFPKLSSMGQVQAKKLTTLFDKNKKYMLLSSQMTRALQTAKYISEHLSVDINKHHELKERYEFEEIPGRGYQDYLNQIKQSNQNRNFVLPNGMTSNKKAEQVIDLIYQYITAHPNVSLIAITHGGTILDVLRTLYANKDFKKVNASISTWQDIKIPPSSITTIQINKELKELLTIGSTPHL